MSEEPPSKKVGLLLEPVWKQHSFCMTGMRVAPCAWQEKGFGDTMHIACYVTQYNTKSCGHCLVGKKPCLEVCPLLRHRFGPFSDPSSCLPRLQGAASSNWRSLCLMGHESLGTLTPIIDCALFTASFCTKNRTGHLLGHFSFWGRSRKYAIPALRSFPANQPISKRLLAYTLLEELC